MKEEIKVNIINHVPYQQCPICIGEGKIIGNGTSAHDICPTCQGARIIPMCPVPELPAPILDYNVFELQRRNDNQSITISEFQRGIQAFIGGGLESVAFWQDAKPRLEKKFKDEAIKFAKWISDNGWSPPSTSIEQLYADFNNPSRRLGHAFDHEQL